MLQAAITGKAQATLIETRQPQAKENWVVVQIHIAPMCAEYKGFIAGNTATHLGHEAAGEVVEIAQPGRVRVGDRVVVMPQYSCGTCALCLAGDYIFCQQTVDFARFTGSHDGSATMAEYILKPDWLLAPIPEQMSYDHASMACCGLGATFGAFERLQTNAFDTVLITGLGPVGLGAVINARYRGARVLAVESNRWRAQRALELGAAAVFDPNDGQAIQQIMDFSGGRGVDQAVDCSGVVAAHRLCIDATRRLGKVAFVGESSVDTPLRVSPDMIRKGLMLIGSWHYNLKHTPKIMRLIAGSGPSLDKLISHRFPLAQIEQAWATQASGECGKVLLKPWPDVQS